MGLLDDINREQQAGRMGPRCPVAVLNDRLDKRDAADLQAALADRGVTGAAIGRALRGRGLSISDGGLMNHRRGSCSCPKAE